MQILLCSAAYKFPFIFYKQVIENLSDSALGCRIPISFHFLLQTNLNIYHILLWAAADQFPFMFYFKLSWKKITILLWAAADQFLFFILSNIHCQSVRFCSELPQTSFLSFCSGLVGALPVTTFSDLSLMLCRSAWMSYSFWSIFIDLSYVFVGFWGGPLNCIRT